MTKRSGGGISMSITKSGKGSQKVEPKAHGVNVSGASQFGQAVAFKKTPLYGGKGFERQGEGPTESRSYRNSATSGPGSQRTIYPKGTQTQTPAPRPIGPTKDTLAEYGGDIPGRRR